MPEPEEWEDEPTQLMPRVQEDVTSDIHSDSVLASLRKSIEQDVQERFIDIEVPDRGMVVRYGEVDADEVFEIVERRRKQYKAKKIDLFNFNYLAACDILARSCLGMYSTEDEAPPVGSELPVFGDPDVAEALGIEPGRAVDAVTALYRLKAHVTQAAQEVTAFSGLGDQSAERDLLGNF